MMCILLFPLLSQFGFLFLFYSLVSWLVSSKLSAAPFFVFSLLLISSSTSLFFTIPYFFVYMAFNVLLSACGLPRPMVSERILF